MAEIELGVDGRSYAGWEEVTLRRSLREAAASFSLRLTDRWAADQIPWRILPGARVTVSAAGQLVMTGHVDAVDAALGARTHRLAVTGRSLTADLVDCAALVSGGQFQGYSIANVARALAAPFQIPVDAPSPGAAFADVQINQGETCFQLLERLARVRGLLVTDTPSGALRLVDAAAFGGPAYAVQEGHNLLDATVSQDWSQRFSEYVVKAQHAGSDTLSGAAAAGISARVTDSRVTRHRPWMKVAESQADGAAARQRARWQAKTAAGRALATHLEVQGWFAAPGVIWDAGLRVAAVVPTLGLDRVLIAESITLKKGPGGSVARIDAVPAEALTPEPAAPAARGAGTATGAGPDVAGRLEWDWGDMTSIEDG